MVTEHVPSKTSAVPAPAAASSQRRRACPQPRTQGEPADAVKGRRARLPGEDAFYASFFSLSLQFLRALADVPQWIFDVLSQKQGSGDFSLFVSCQGSLSLRNTRPRFSLTVFPGRGAYLKNSVGPHPELNVSISTLWTWKLEKSSQVKLLLSTQIQNGPPFFRPSLG